MDLKYAGFLTKANSCNYCIIHVAFKTQRPYILDFLFIKAALMKVTRLKYTIYTAPTACLWIKLNSEVIFHSLNIVNVV